MTISFTEHPDPLPSGQQPSDGGPFQITVFGNRIDGTTVTNIVSVPSFLTLQPFHVTGFNNLVSVHWFQGTGAAGGGPTHQFDHVTVSVPEPASVILAAFGVVVATLRRARFQRRYHSR